MKPSLHRKVSPVSGIALASKARMDSLELKWLFLSLFAVRRACCNLSCSTARREASNLHPFPCPRFSSAKCSNCSQSCHSPIASLACANALTTARQEVLPDTVNRFRKRLMVFLWLCKFFRLNLRIREAAKSSLSSDVSIAEDKLVVERFNLRSLRRADFKSLLRTRTLSST